MNNISFLKNRLETLSGIRSNYKNDKNDTLIISNNSNQSIELVIFDDIYLAYQGEEIIFDDVDFDDFIIQIKFWLGMV